MKANIGSGMKRSPLWVFAFGLNLAAAGQMIFWSDGFRLGFYNTFGVFLILFTAYACLTLCLAEISSCLPFSGGSYALARVTAGPWIGFVVGCADRIDLLGNIGLTMMILSWIITKAIGIHQLLAQIFCYIPIYALASFSLWHSTQEYYWWSMAGGSIFYAVLLMIFLFSCSPSANFGDGLPTSSIAEANGLEFLSLFPRCMLFYSGLQFIQMGAVDMRDAKQNIPRLLLTGLLFAFIIGIFLLFLVASHSPYTMIHQSSEFPLPIVAALAHDLRQSSPTLIALLLCPMFFTALQGYLFALQRVSMAMLQSNLLLMVRPIFLKKVTDEQFVLLRVSWFILPVNALGFYLLREEWFWVLVQFAMFGALTSQCANLYSFVVFRMQFRSLDRGFVSPLGIAGAVYPCLVFVLVVVGILACGRDGRIALILYLGLVFVMGIAYFCRLSGQQRFSAEEEAALFVAHVIRHNAEKSKRLKRRASRAANVSFVARNQSFLMAPSSFRSSNSSSYLQSAVSQGNMLLSAAATASANVNQLILSSVPMSPKKKRPSIEGNSEINATNSTDKENANLVDHTQHNLDIPAIALPKGNDPNTNDNTNGSITYKVPETNMNTCTVTSLSIEEDTQDNVLQQQAATDTTTNTTTEMNAHSNDTANNENIVVSSETPGTMHRTASRWQIPKKALNLALQDPSLMPSITINTAMSATTSDDAGNSSSNSAPASVSTPSGAASAAFQAAANAFLSQGEAGRKRRLDQRKEALIRAFKQPPPSTRTKKLPKHLYHNSSNNSHSNSGGDSSKNSNPYQLVRLLSMATSGFAGGSKVPHVSKVVPTNINNSNNANNAGSNVLSDGVDAKNSNVSTNAGSNIDAKHKYASIASDNNDKQKPVAYEGKSLASAATHVVIAKHWAKLPSLRNMSSTLTTAGKNGKNDEESEEHHCADEHEHDIEQNDATHSRHRNVNGPNNRARPWNQRKNVHYSTANNDGSESEENSRSFSNYQSYSANNSKDKNESSSIKEQEDDPTLIIADMKPTDLIDRYYTDDQFNYHAFLDDVFNVKKPQKAAAAEVDMYRKPATTNTNKNTSNDIKNSKNTNTNTNTDKIINHDPDAEFAGRKLHRIVVPPELMDPATLANTTTLNKTDYYDENNDGDIEQGGTNHNHNIGSNRPEKVVNLPVTSTMDCLDTYLKIETPLTHPAYRTHSQPLNHDSNNNSSSGKSSGDSLHQQGIARFSPTFNTNVEVFDTITTANVSDNPQQTAAVPSIAATTTHLKRPSPRSLPPLTMTTHIVMNNNQFTTSSNGENNQETLYKSAVSPLSVSIPRKIDEEEKGEEK